MWYKQVDTLGMFTLLFNDEIELVIFFRFFSIS